MTVSHHPPGEMPASYRAGDIGLVRHWVVSTLGEMIQAGERVDYGHTPWANFTHAFLIATDAGLIIEANEAGIELRQISRYRDADLYIVHPPNASAQLRAYAVRWAMARVGARYDLLDFVGLALQALFGARVSIHSTDRYICSGEVARATECYTDHGYPKAPEAMKPADLAAFYGLRMHEPPYPLSPFARILDLAATVGRLIGRFLKP